MQKTFSENCTLLTRGRLTTFEPYLHALCNIQHDQNSRICLTESQLKADTGSSELGVGFGCKLSKLLLENRPNDTSTGRLVPKIRPLELNSACGQGEQRGIIEHVASRISE